MARKRPSLHQWNGAGDTQRHDHHYRKPRSLRTAGDEDKQIPIHDGDLLKLGASTEFLVLKISSNVRALA
ncbi:MAG: hypothetical protein ACLS3M_03675 [Collinsella sp.]